MSSPALAQPTWQTTVKVKREIRSQLIEPFTLAPDSNEEITGINDVHRLVERIAQGELSVRDITETYVRKSVAQHYCQVPIHVLTSWL